MGKAKRIECAIQSTSTGDFGGKKGELHVLFNPLVPVTLSITTEFEIDIQRGLCNWGKARQIEVKYI